MPSRNVSEKARTEGSRERTGLSRWRRRDSPGVSGTTGASLKTSRQSECISDDCGSAPQPQTTITLARAPERWRGRCFWLPRRGPVNFGGQNKTLRSFRFRHCEQASIVDVFREGSHGRLWTKRKPPYSGTHFYGPISSHTPPPAPITVTVTVLLAPGLHRGPRS